MKSEAVSERGGISVNVVDGLFAIADGLQAVARSLNYLGNGNAATEMGAIEGLSVKIHEGLEAIAVSVDAGLAELNDAIAAKQK